MIALPHRPWRLLGTGPYYVRPAWDDYKTRHRNPAYYLINRQGYNALVFAGGAVFTTLSEALHIEQEASLWA